ncbi:MAG TPA: c-type cytochrome [Pyrinomonadaceae bacterium]|jgi:outer membrane lipoprotein-sorting protein|nr:c-type cytochrome [Pyrinomonadaceae bacterium]
MKETSVARIIIIFLFLIAVSLPLTISSSSQTQDKPVETVAKNIQVLKGMPESQLGPVMNLMRTALGVRCDFCHIAENGKYQLDDKPAKATARRMIQMTFAINKANFNGETEVTCNTCHRGSTRPVGLPAIGQAAFENTTRSEPSANVAEKRPTVDEVFDKYLQAVGGKNAVEKIQTRVSEASLQRPKIANPSGKPSTIQLYQKAPNKMMMVITAPDGSVIDQYFNGMKGWIKTPTQQRELTDAELAQVKQQADLHKEVTLKSQYSNLRVGNKQKVNERDAYVVVGTNASNNRERLFFDAETGLLLRRVVLNQTILGQDPVQTDFSDYREVDGVKLPFMIQISSLDNNHNGQTRTFSQIKHNVPVDDAKFEGPPK